MAPPRSLPGLPDDFTSKVSPLLLIAKPPGKTESGAQQEAGGQSVASTDSHFSGTEEEASDIALGLFLTFIPVQQANRVVLPRRRRFAKGRALISWQSHCKQTWALH